MTMPHGSVSRDPEVDASLGNLRAFIGVQYPGDPSQKQVDSLLASLSLGFVVGYIKKLEQHCCSEQLQPTEK